jgi:integrase
MGPQRPVGTRAVARTFLRTLAPSQYLYSSHILTRVKWRGERLTEIWPLDSGADERARWVQRAKSMLMDRAADRGPPAPSVARRNSLQTDVTAFLETRIGREGYKADIFHLKAWTVLYGALRRTQMTTRHVDLAIAAWRTAGKSAQTILHRCRALRVLWRSIEGPKARTPIEDAQVPKQPRPHPVGLPAGTIPMVAANLQRDKSPKAVQHFARFCVLATTLQRPCQMVRAQPTDVDLVRRVWHVRSAKNEPSHPIPLNDDMLIAWQAFISANCWGPYRAATFRKALRRAGFTAAVRPYNLRHEGAIFALERGADLGDLQGLLGHTHIETTRRNYGPLADARQRRVSEQMTGRLSAGIPGEGTPGDSEPVRSLGKSATFVRQEPRATAAEIERTHTKSLKKSAGKAGKDPI